MIRIGSGGIVFQVQVLCDWCGERISADTGSRVEWQVDERGEPLDGVLYYSHSTCSPLPYNQSERPPGWRSAPLHDLPTALAAALGFSSEHR